MKLKEKFDNVLNPKVILKPRKTSKNIVFCCDGTGNEYGINNTNVVHAMENVLINSSQAACYTPGVGTFDLFGQPRKASVGMWLGKAFGYGLQNNIMDGYKFLMSQYKDGDKVFILGFSRGAFVARALAGMLHKCGLLEDGCYNLIPYVSKIYHQQNNKSIAEGFKKTFGRECKPHFLGVWDTVRSLGYFLGKKFPNNVLNPDVKYAYQAVSIDEKREKFQVSLWNQAATSIGQTIEQVWFAGVHSDVGGWYKERGLSDLTLQWMLKKAETAGLLLAKGWEGSLNPDCNATLHESRTGFWKLWPPITRVIPENALIHKSVFLRMENPDNHYHPENIPNNYQIVD